MASVLFAAALDAPRGRSCGVCVWRLLAYHSGPLGLGQGRVEERRDHREQPVSAVDETYLRRAREHGELGPRAI